MILGSGLKIFVLKFGYTLQLGGLKTLLEVEIPKNTSTYVYVFLKTQAQRMCVYKFLKS